MSESVSVTGTQKRPLDQLDLPYLAKSHYPRKVQVGSRTHGGAAEYVEDCGNCKCRWPCPVTLLLAVVEEQAGELVRVRAELEATQIKIAAVQALIPNNGSVYTLATSDLVEALGATEATHLLIPRANLSLRSMPMVLARGQKCTEEAHLPHPTCPDGDACGCTCHEDGPAAMCGEVGPRVGSAGQFVARCELSAGHDGIHDGPLKEAQL